MANKEKKVIDRGMIEQFAQKISEDKAQTVFYELSDKIDDVALELSQTNNLVNVQNINLIISGDALTNTLTPVSELEFYLSVRSAQIEINSIGKIQNKFKKFFEKFKEAWINRNGNSAKIRKKTQKKLKKKNSEITEKQLLEKKEKPYNLENLKTDFFEGLASNLTNMTVLYNQPNKIRILARDEFGYRINIYPVLKHDDYFKIWDQERAKFVEIRPYEAKKLLEQKTREIEKQNSELSNTQIVYEIIRIFKSLFYNLENSYNYRFIESLVYSCPVSLFKYEDENYVYKTFLKVLNFLINTSFGEIRSIYNQDKTIFQQEGISAITLRGFLKEIKEYLE